MKRGIAIVIVCALLLAGQGLAAQPWPSRAATVIQLSNLGWSDKTVGTFDGVTGTLSTNLQGIAIYIVSDGVVLDGGGKTVSGSGSFGVGLSGRTGVTVKNITVTGFSNGIYLSGGSGNTVSGCTVSGNGRGLYLNLSHRNTLTDNTASGNQYGIFLAGSEDNILTDNTVEGSTVDGIHIENSNGSTLTGNTVSGSAGYGLNLIGGTGSKVYHNRFEKNKAHAKANDGNDFYLELPDGGNYWDSYEGPDEKAPIGIGDDPYRFDTSHFDEYPWLEPDGWDAPPPATPTPEPTIGKTFVTGGGWVNPPQASIAGKAHVEVECRYAKGAETPTGKLDLKVGKLHFQSTSFDWLSIIDGQVWCLGQGSTADGSVYTFAFGAADGGAKSRSKADKVRVKVWNDGTVLYDSEPGAEDWAPPEVVLGGGSITIHKD